MQALYQGGGGGMQAAADGAAAYVEAVARSEGRTGTSVARSVARARRESLGSLRAATATPCTKEHLHQVGEYQVQDISLSDPFQVNEALVMNAYGCFARVTGCRPQGWRSTPETTMWTPTRGGMICRRFGMAAWRL